MQKTINYRRTFSVKGQLIGKLGPSGYAALVGELERGARKPRRQRRKRVD